MILACLAFARRHWTSMARHSRLHTSELSCKCHIKALASAVQSITAAWLWVGETVQHIQRVLVTTVLGCSCWVAQSIAAWLSSRHADGTHLVHV